MTDVSILLNSFLGDDFAQSVTAEMGEGVIGLAYMKGMHEMHEMLIRSKDPDHIQIAEDVEAAIQGLFIGPNDKPEWEPIDLDEGDFK